MDVIRFDADIVLDYTDVGISSRRADPAMVMDAVEDAIAAVPGIEAINICYMGARIRNRLWIRLSPHGVYGHSANASIWNQPLQLIVESAARRAIAVVTRNSSLRTVPLGFDGSGRVGHQPGALTTLPLGLPTMLPVPA